jgi:GDP-mannose 6-dehydrogenase
LKEDHKVVGVDVSADKAARITFGLSPVSDPGLEELLAAGREDGWLSADTDLGGQLDDADMAMIHVGGPSLMGSGLDLIQVGAVSEVLGVALKTRGPARDPLIVT